MPALPATPAFARIATARTGRRLAACAVLLALPLAAGCGDLPLLAGSADRVPSRMTVEIADDRLVTGQSTPLRLHLFDQHGRAFDPLPPWAAPSWTSNGGEVRVMSDRIEAVTSGMTTVDIRLAGVEGQARLRINPASLQVQVAAAYITQVVQRRDGSVPLVAGRNGHLRVFLTGDQPNFYRTTVRTHFYHAGVRVATLQAEAEAEGIPVQVEEGALAWSWNVAVPGTLIRPGASFLVEIDAGPGLPAAANSVLRFPANGVPRALDARVVPRFDVTFVPIHHQGFATGNIHPGNVEQFMAATRDVWPILDTDIRIRAPYSTPTRAITNADWSALLQEVRLLWLVEGRPSYYHGILRREGAWAGFAYIGTPVGLTYDLLPAASWTLAHEFGHNFNRLHAPCGQPSGIDAAFPHAGGAIGVFGLASDGVTLIPPQRADLMGYCSPRWVSDYNYNAVFNFRANSPFGEAGAQPPASMSGLVSPASGAGPVPAPAVPALLVSGRIEATRLVLEPAFQLTTRPYLPTAPGPYTLEGLDAGGGVLFAHSFAGDVPAHGEPGERHFAFAIPIDAGTAGRLATLRVGGGGRSAERAAVAGGSMGAAGTGGTGGGVAALRNAGAAPATLRAVAPGTVALDWDAVHFPLVVVRDPATGHVLAFARGGSARLLSDARELELHFSDGVMSTALRMAVAP